MLLELLFVFFGSRDSKVIIILSSNSRSSSKTSSSCSSSFISSSIKKTSKKEILLFLFSSLVKYKSWIFWKVFYVYFFSIVRENKYIINVS